jgi:UDP-N-acetylglucosamine 4-epimerase
MGDYKMLNKELYNNSYHKENLTDYKFLITGGAGFIGSNLVDYLIKYNAGHVRVLDNLSNGYYENIKDFVGLPNFEFINGDIRDYDICAKSLIGIDFVSHQAALGSVPRSIEDPINTNSVNIDGFLKILTAAKDVKTLKKFVYAASSSTYGDSTTSPKKEGQEGKPLSPYAVTKLVNEVYAEVFSKVFGFNTIGLRYFNVFGPKQNPLNPYAAVIPIFCRRYLENSKITINGDGSTSRDFTFIENVVNANIKALFSTNILKHEVLNVACGAETSLNEVVNLLSNLSNKEIEVEYLAERRGDVKHSLANIEKASKVIGYEPIFDFKKGLEITYNWYKKMYK